MSRALATAIAACAFAVLAQGAAAHSDYVQVVGGSTLMYQQYPGLTPDDPDNNLTITYKSDGTGQYFVIDDPTSTGITNRSPCVPLTLDDLSVRCPASGIANLVIDTGTGTDDVRVSAPQPAAVYGGPGDDTLRGGAGATQFFGQQGADTLVAGNGAGNVLDGGTGGNTLDAVNSQVDTINHCTPLDTVTADPSDVLMEACPTTDVASPPQPSGVKPPPSGGGGGGGGSGGGTTGPSKGPALTRFHLSPYAFRAAAHGSAFAARAGARLSFKLSAPASVTFRVERLRAGRRSGPRVGRSFKLRKLAEGIVQRRFTGRVGGRSLRPGRYRLVATPSAAGGSKGGSSSDTFRIVGGA
jgi:RTX calcium-binding nonapeptide repeat (4 copies)